MRIGILTQPLYTNYGGIVQCYALQTALQRMGHETVVLQREFNRQYTFKGACIYYIKHIVKFLLGRRSSWHYYVSQERRDYIAKETNEFVEARINPRSEHCYTTEQLATEVERLHLDAIIVGSDQVWRPYYSPCQPNYFLDFLDGRKDIKKMSYAASFGSDEWTFDEALTKQCGALLHQFDAVSVREQSAIGLCKEHFGVEAQHVLDPTLLLEKDDYRAVSGLHSTVRGSLFCYVLDRSKEKREIIAKIADQTKLQPFGSMPELTDDIYNLYGKIDKCVYPSVEDWLSAFDEAKMVTTDSFHGTVFSIIFNKPFWVIGNEGRGMARFQSLLSQFGLEDRMLTPSKLYEIDLNQPVDWEKVNHKREELKKLSIEFLETALKK